LKHLALVLVLLGGASGFDEAGNDEVVQLQLTSSQSQPPCDAEPSYLASALAQHAFLTVVSKEGKSSRGILSLAGKSVHAIRMFTDRPFREAMTIPMAYFVRDFTRTFSRQSGGYPNAALAGKLTQSDEMKQVTVVLTSASYTKETVVFEWSSDDDTIDETLEFVSASLFIDSFWEDLRHPKEYVKHEICVHLVQTIMTKGVGGVSCIAEDIAGLGICAAIDIEDAELLTPFCEATLVRVCQKVVGHLTNAVAKALSDGQEDKAQACLDAGYPEP